MLMSALTGIVGDSIWVHCIIIVVGIMIVLGGADWLTKGAVGLAERMRIPQIVIGLTIVAMGTSMPEFFVSLLSALKGTPDLAVGNVVGSNIFNTYLIVGLAAAVAPIHILKSTVKRDIPFALLASAALLGMSLDGNITRTDAGILFLLFCLFMAVTLHYAKGQKEEVDVSQTPLNSWKALLFILVGLAGLIIGSYFFVESATQVASSLGVSDAIIGLTIVAGGTSLPELATSLVAAKRGNSGIAIGNVLGSNVFNILMILGLTGLVSPMEIQGITTLDFVMMLISVVLLWLFSFTKYLIARWEGVVLTAIYVGYVTYLIMNI